MKGVITERSGEAEQDVVRKRRHFLRVEVVPCPIAAGRERAVVVRLAAGVLGAETGRHQRLALRAEQAPEGFPDECIGGVCVVKRIVDLDDRSGCGQEFLLEEGRQVDLADEADALRIFLFGGREFGQAGDLADLRLGQVADREQGAGKLFLRQLAEEIALVLVRVGTRQDAVEPFPVRSGAFRPAAVMPGGHIVGPEALRGLQEGVELDLTVAEDVGIGGPPGGIFGEHLVHDALAVGFGKVHEIEGNADLARNQFRHETVFLPLAVAVQSRVGVMPVLHEHGEYVVPLLLEQQGRDAGIDASGKSYANFHGDAKIGICRDFRNFYYL